MFVCCFKWGSFGGKENRSAEESGISVAGAEGRRDLRLERARFRKYSRRIRLRFFKCCDQTGNEVSVQRRGSDLLWLRREMEGSCNIVMRGGVRVGKLDKD